MNLQFSGRRNGFKKYIKSLDKILLLVVIATLALSLFAINSATFQQEINGRCMLIQSGGILLGFVFMLLISKIDYDLISDLWPYIALATSVVLVVTAFIAPDINGNRNWIMLGPANVQPSEFGKLCFAVTFSAHLTKIGEQLNKIKNVLALCIHFALYFIPILLQGDIGTALVYFGMFLIIMFVAGLRYRYFIVGAALAAAAVPFVWDHEF